MTIRRTLIAGLALSAAGFVGLVGYEGYTSVAVIPIPGDVPTIGLGTTEGVKLGDKITPPEAIARAYRDVQKKEKVIKRCIHVEMHPWEYDAAVSLAYNIGETAFCNSTAAKRFNARDYAGACEAFLLFKRAGGKDCSVRANRCYGLWERREGEYKRCMGIA